jgi:hypothetical protein
MARDLEADRLGFINPQLIAIELGVWQLAKEQEQDED